jgi:peptidoglycan/LPS O-acetylase OafA/YrhL
LRGYLALSVFFHHGFHWLYGLKDPNWSVPPSGNVLANMGSATMALFFMITAVLFYPKVLRRLSDHEWLAHFISRIFRLTPLLWVATAAVVVVILILNKFSLGNTVLMIFERESESRAAKGNRLSYGLGEEGFADRAARERRRRPRKGLGK